MLLVLVREVQGTTGSGSSSRLNGDSTESLIHLLLYNLLSLALERICPGFGVLNPIGLLALGAFLLDESLLGLLFDGFGYLSGAMNLLDTRKMLVFFDQSLSILHSTLLSWCKLSKFFVCTSFPKPNICVVATTDNIRVIHCIVDGEYALHSFRVIHIASISVPISQIEETDGSIVGTCDEFSSSRSPID